MLTEVRGQLVVRSLYLDEVDDEWTAEPSGAFVREPDGHVHVLVPEGSGALRK